MRFEEVGHLAGVAGNASGVYQAGMGVAAGDLDGDGLIDLAVTNFYGESTTFFRNLGGGVFTDATASIGLAVASRRLLGFGLALLDADNDGRLDMASANGHVNDLRPNYPYRMPAQLLLGGADGRLRDVSDRAGTPWQVPRMGRGLAVGDLDNDGRQDVLILSHNQPLAYFHNRTEGGRFLTLRLEGRQSNRDAVGAKVAVVSGGMNRVAWRIGGGSYQSASDPRLHFGLGAADRIDRVEIVWPSGRADRHQGLEPNTGYLLREGDDLGEAVARLCKGQLARRKRGPPRTSPRVDDPLPGSPDRPPSDDPLERGEIEKAPMDSQSILAPGVLPQQAIGPEVDRSRAACTSPATVLLLAAWIGLAAGFLDVGLMILKNRLVDGDFYRIGADFFWLIPAGVTTLLLLPGTALALVLRFRRAGLTLGVVTGLLSFVGFLDLSARLPLAPWSALLLTGGLATQSARLVSRRSREFLKLVRRTSPVLAGVLLTLTVGAIGRPCLVGASGSEHAAPVAPGAENVLLIVWDTVRAGT